MRVYDVNDDENEGGQTVGLSHGKPITPKGTQSTQLVDEDVVNKIKGTFKNNRTADKKKIINSNIEM